MLKTDNAFNENKSSMQHILGFLHIIPDSFQGKGRTNRKPKARLKNRNRKIPAYPFPRRQG